MPWISATNALAIWTQLTAGLDLIGGLWRALESDVGARRDVGGRSDEIVYPNVIRPSEFFGLDLLSLSDLG
jgi:hypothetical protein